MTGRVRGRTGGADEKPRALRLARISAHTRHVCVPCARIFPHCIIAVELRRVSASASADKLRVCVWVRRGANVVDDDVCAWRTAAAIAASGVMLLYARAKVAHHQRRRRR